MRLFSLSLTLILCSLALCGTRHAYGGWGAGGCSFAPAMPAVAGPLFFAAPSVAPIYQWRPAGDGEWALYLGERQVGNVRAEDGQYFRHKDGGGFEEEASEPPIRPPAEAGKRKCGCCKGCACKKGKCGCKDGSRCADGCKCGVKIIGKDEQPPCACCGDDCRCATKPCDKPGCRCVLQGSEALAAPREDVPNYGVMQEEISRAEKSTINGREVTKEQALEILETAPASDGTVPDDSAKLSLTVVSDDPAVLKAAQADLQRPELAAFRQHALAQVYDLNGPEKPMLACGFIERGTQVIVQTPQGKVLWDDYTEGYRGMASLLAAAQSPFVVKEVRKLDPTYNRASDPGPHNPGPSAPNGGSSGFRPAHVMLALGGLLCFGTFAFFCIAGCALGWRLLRRVA